MLSFPVTLSKEIFFDPNLSDADVRLICMAQSIRSTVQYERDEAARKNILENVRTSIFSAPRNKHRDTVRREFNKLQKNEAAQKYLKIYFVKDKLNTEHKIVLHFQDDVPRYLQVDKKNDLNNKINFEDEILLRAYLKDTSFFSGETPETLMLLCNVKAAELVKGLIYINQMKRKLDSTGDTIKNPKGYLISLFDEKGLFKYNLTPKRYLANDVQIKSDSTYEYELTAENFGILRRMVSGKRSKFHFDFRETGKFVYLKSMTMAGKPNNPSRWLKRFDIPFQIVDCYEEI